MVFKPRACSTCGKIGHNDQECIGVKKVWRPVNKFEGSAQTQTNQEVQATSTPKQVNPGTPVTQKCFNTSTIKF